MASFASQSFASQLLDVFYDLVERVTGYSARAEDDKDAQKPSKLASVEKFQTEEVVEIRSRNLPVSGGSGAEVNLDGM